MTGATISRISAAPPTGSPALANPWLAWSLAVLPFVALAGWHWRLPPFADAGDYAAYLLHADALAHGRAYGDIGYIFTPYNPYIGPPAEPPGLPLTLLPIFLISGRSWDACKLAMVASGVAFLVISGRYFARRRGLVLGAGAAALCGASIELTYATNTVMSDLGFCALVWLVITLADAPGAWTRRRALAVAALGLAAISYRLAGVALVPAMLTFAALRSRERGAAVWIAPLVWVAAGAAALAARPEALGSALDLNRRAVLATFVQSVYAYRFAVSSSSLYPFAGDRANDVYHVVAYVFMAVGLWRWLRFRWRDFLPLFSVAYGAMLLVVVVHDDRYLWPLFPLLAFAFLDGLSAAMRAAGRLTRRSWGYARAEGVAVAAGALLMASAVVAHAAEPRPPAFSDNADARRLFERIRAMGAAAPTRVVFVNPRVLTWETGVPAMGLFAARRGEMLAELRRQGITHVVVGDFGLEPGLDRILRALVRAAPAAFAPVFRSGEFTIYRFVPSPAGTSSSVPPSRERA